MISRGVASALVVVLVAAVAGQEPRRLATGDVGALAFADGGRALASWDADGDGTFRLWELPSGRVLRRARPPLGAARRTSLAPDGRALAWVDDGLTVWDLIADKALGSWPAGKDVVAVACSPGGRFAALARGGQLSLIDVTTRSEVLCGGAPAVKRGDASLSLVFAPDGRALALAASRQERGGAALLVWDVPTGRRLPLHGAEVGAARAAAFSADGATLVAVAEESPGTRAEYTLRAWDVATGREVRRFALPEAEVDGLAFAPDGRLLVVWGERGVEVWEAASGGSLGRLAAPRGTLRAAALAPDGHTLAAGGEDAGLLLWNLASPGKDDRPRGAATSWDDLARADARQAYRAVWALAAAPGESVAFLRERLRPASPPAEALTGRLIAGLDSDSFEAREEATRRLADLEALAEPALRRALERGPGAEAQRRIEALLQPKLTGRPAPEVLRAVRAVAVLERVATPEARALLKTLAGGAVEARLTREAKAALRRLAAKG